MKSRAGTCESIEERKIERQGSESLRLARSFALATALSLLLQPLTTTAFAKEQAQSKTSSKSGSIFSRIRDKERSSKGLLAEKDEAKSDEDAPAKTDSKKEVKKESVKKDAKETAKEAAADKKAQDKAKKDAAKNAKIEEKQAKEKAKEQAKAKSDASAKTAKEAAKTEPKKPDEKAASTTADDADKAAKKKKGGWFNRPKGKNDDDEIIVVEEEVIETVEPATKSAADAKSAAGAASKPPAVSPTSKPAVGTTPSGPAAGETVALDKPNLLPDNALVSVLQDISKALGEANEGAGIETADDKVIVGLARQVLEKSLGAGELKDNRILAPEFNNTAKNTMTTEAWTSGDMVISDKLRGSVATVWGKRINGLLHVTIAGECQNKTLSNGEKVGEFIVVIKGRSPVKSGFDIQSQSDVTYWIGALDSVTVEAACSRLKEKSAEGEAQPSSSTKSVDVKGEVKKKSPVVLDTVLTRRRLNYLRAMELYQVQQQLLAKQLADEAAVELAVATTADTGRGAAGDEVTSAKRKNRDDEAGPEQIAIQTPSAPKDKNVGQNVKRTPASSESDVADDGDEDSADSAEAPTAARTRNDKVMTRSADDDDDDDKVANATDDSDDDKAARKSSDTKVASRSSDKESTAKATSDKVASRSNSEDQKPGTSDKDIDSTRVGSSKTTDGDRSSRSTDQSNKTPAKPILQTGATSAKPKTGPDVSSKPTKNPWTNKDIDNKDDSTSSAQNSSASGSDSPSTKWPSTLSTTSTNPGTNPSISSPDNPTAISTNPIPAKSDPVWKDDWSRDGGDSTPATSQSSSTAGSSSSSPSLTRISVAVPTPAPASASSRAWESPALNLAPRSPSLGANLLCPERAIAGQFLTVSVLAKDKQPERSVELSFNGSTISTDLNGQALYMIPEDMPPGQTLHISLAERPEVSSKVIDILQQLHDGSAPRTPRIDKVSPFVASDGVLVIDGHEFDGFADKNRIVLDNGIDAKVIASSPVQLRILIPGKIQPGTHTVTITDANLKSAPAKFEFIKAEIEQPDVRKTKGALDRIVVRIHGTRQPVPVRVVNRTPDVIKMSRGDNLLITTPGGSDNSSVLGVKQLKKGDYKVEASIEI